MHAEEAKDSMAQLKISHDDKMQVQVKDDTNKFTAAPTADDEGSSGEYRCRIEEEPPSPVNDN